jgi:hypothetical protein
VPVTSEPRVFCSNLAREAREPLAGTASHALGCVLFSYPKRLWGRDALDSEGLPSAVKNELARLRDERDVITRFVSHEGTWNGRTELAFFPQRRRYVDVAMDDVAALLASLRRGELPEGGASVDTPILLVCTHGQRDRCCARFGLELTNELRALPVGRVEVREASHLGGDRFAPTVLVLPSGHMYGHLEPSDAPGLALAASGGAPLLPRFRGSLWLDPLAQLAEVAAFGLSQFRGVVPTLGPIEVTELDARHASLRTTAVAGDRRLELTLRCVLERRQVFGDCRNAERDRRGGVEVWRILDVATAPPA